MGVAFSPDGKLLLSVAGQWSDPAAAGEIKVWGTATGNELANLEPGLGCVYSVVVAADGKTCFTAHHDGSIRKWHLPKSASSAGESARFGKSVKCKAAGEVSPPSRSLTGRTPGVDALRLCLTRCFGYVLRVQLEAEVDLPEMIVAGEYIHDAKVLHDDRAGEIDEGDVRLVVKLAAASARSGGIAGARGGVTDECLRLRRKGQS